MDGPSTVLMSPGTSRSTELPNPFGLQSFVSYDTAWTGRAAIAVATGRTTSDRPPVGGTTRVYDASTHRWLPVTPPPAPVGGITATTWTPAGLVVLGSPAEKTTQLTSGLLLRPKR
jgi:hypothetical protein